MALVYCRTRKHSASSGPIWFLEFFLEYNAASNHLTLPLTVVERFEKRSRLLGSSMPRPLGPNLSVPGFAAAGPLGMPHVASEAYAAACKADMVPLGPCLAVFLVNSEASGLTKRTADDIRANGVWCAYSDVVPKGGPIGQSLAVVFGVPVDPAVFMVLYNGHANVQALVKANVSIVGTYTEPCVVYHGTARANAKSITSSGLQPSQGMLGNAVYFGSFWKAMRFAVMTQDYAKRDGAIFRCYGFWSRPYFKTMAVGGPCPCAECAPRLASPTGLKMALLADHGGLWQRFADVAFVVPEVDGPIKNEECAATDASNVILDSIGYARAASEHHDPFARSSMIL